MYGNSIAQLESDVVWDIVTSNPAMADGTALFHATNKNLAGSGAALGVDSVGLARAAMRKQTGLDKKTVLNIRPAFLIVPASLELKAEQLVAQNLVPAQSGNVVPQSIRTLLPIADARVWSETNRVDLRVAEVENPRPGDRLEIDGDAFLIQGEPVRDRERLVWTVDLRPA